MAEILDVNTMLGTLYEPKRKFRWILSIAGIDAYTAKLAARPNFVHDEVVVDFINRKIFHAGKQTPQPLAITLYDPIAPSEAQKVMEWVRLQYEVVTGRMGYANVYKKTFNLRMLDPVGAIVEDWEIQGAWCQEVNFNDLDYASSDLAEVALTLRYDQAVLLF